MGLIKTTILVTGGIVLVGAALAAWGPLSSYVRTGARLARDHAHDAVPTGFEIERIQTMVHDLDEVVGEQQARLVKQRVDLEYLQKEVARCQERVAQLTDEVSAARAVLAEERPNYRINGVEHPREQVVRQARLKAEALVRARDIAAAKHQTMTALENALARAESQLADARAQRETYAMRLANLRAQAQTVAIRQELATQMHELPEAIDAGAFQEVEQAFARVERELTVQDRLLDQATEAPRAQAITFTREPDQDVLAVLDDALGTPRTVTAPPAETGPVTD